MHKKCHGLECDHYGSLLRVGQVTVHKVLVSFYNHIGLLWNGSGCFAVLCEVYVCRPHPLISYNMQQPCQ